MNIIPSIKSLIIPSVVSWNELNEKILPTKQLAQAYFSEFVSGYHQLDGKNVKEKLFFYSEFIQKAKELKDQHIDPMQRDYLSFTNVATRSGFRGTFQEKELFYQNFENSQAFVKGILAFEPIAFDLEKELKRHELQCQKIEEKARKIFGPQKEGQSIAVENSTHISLPSSSSLSLQDESQKEAFDPTTSDLMDVEGASFEKKEVDQRAIDAADYLLLFGEE